MYFFLLIQVSSKLEIAFFVLYFSPPFTSQCQSKGFIGQDSKEGQTVGGDKKMKPQSSQGMISDWWQDRKDFFKRAVWKKQRTKNVFSYIE